MTSENDPPDCCYYCKGPMPNQMDVWSLWQEYEGWEGGQNVVRWHPICPDCLEIKLDSQYAD